MSTKKTKTKKISVENTTPTKKTTIEQQKEELIQLVNNLIFSVNEAGKHFYTPAVYIQGQKALLKTQSPFEPVILAEQSIGAGLGALASMTHEATRILIEITKGDVVKGSKKDNDPETV